jgi:hypothetical protein
VNAADANPPVAPSASPERRGVLLLCLLAAVHVFVFSAAFPFFNNMDEIPHFDLVVKYSHGHFPRGLEPLGEESSLYTLTYASPEYMWLPKSFPNGRFPEPFWIQPAGESSKASRQDAAFQRADAAWHSIDKLPFWQNYESSQYPLYYAAAGLWWRAIRALSVGGLRALYCVRFLNLLFVAALVWVGYVAARMIFPESALLRTGVPALIAFFPQQAFYSIQNDVLSPLCFGLAFIGLLRLMDAERPVAGLGIFTGLSLAATFLVKLSNLPLLAVSGLVIAFVAWRRRREGKLRASLPALVLLVLCATLPAATWMAWMRHAFGNFTGMEAKLAFITWTRKPFGEWWHHPIFTPLGAWTFVSGLLVAFWQGEFRWHGMPLHLPIPDAFFTVLSLSLVTVALVKLRTRTTGQRRALLLSLGCCAAGAAFLAWLSILFDFGICPNPSRENPYFVAGRLVLGTLVPFLLLFLAGLDSLLYNVKNRRARPAALTALILFTLVSEVATDWPVFFSQYNWFHL